MVYTCSYCDTGVMNTGDQYLMHIKGSKHKKKAFHVQAPYEGIEYEEFRNHRESNTGYGNNNGNVNNHFDQHIANKTNGRELISYDDVSGEDDRSRSSSSNITIDDIFSYKNSKTETTKYIISNYAKNQKTAAQALNEISKAMQWTVMLKPVSTVDLRYALAVYIEGIELTIGEGDSKKEAKQNAAAAAIHEIKRKLQPDNKSTENRVVEETRHTESLADCYEKITRDKLKEIERNCRKSFLMPKRYAAFIITEKVDQPAKYGTIVAFGAGKGVNNDIEDESNYPDYYLKNFDALVLAKRSLQCFFYNQILLIFKENNAQPLGEKLFLEIGSNGLLKLKRGCRLHLFISHAPQGDCVESIPRKWKDPVKLSKAEMERDKNGIMEPILHMSYSQNIPLNNPGHIRILKGSSKDLWISLTSNSSRNRISRVMTLSPTDKLMSWIHLGIQGAMLSHLISPIYLYSIQFDKDYMHEHISRALLCRVPLENIIKSRGTYYKSVKFFDPYFERVSHIYEDDNDYEDYESTRVGFNWYLNPVTDLAEVVDTRTGCVHRYSPYHLPDGEDTNKCSRLSKICMLMRFKQAVSAAIDYFSSKPGSERLSFLERLNENYSNRHSVKCLAKDYRKLKKCLFESLMKKHYGEWLPNLENSTVDLSHYYHM